MKGECLCGSVKFEITEEIRNLYQCHCSLCRKATGAAANAATFVNEHAFRWFPVRVVYAVTRSPVGSEAIFARSVVVQFLIV
ncbi:GFA family protein [Marinobacter hydrocarbonoclasticus]|uniref:GFA family protein n=1 Tax=Marinobacter nauticus TaxID=2743 RepID=UPI001C97432A|nr:GFA family protein [Marinobacter nauticus]MBY6214221.1 GFA family protein [Marinobacter nauticus]